MERKVGETFTYKGKTYQVIKILHNDKCAECVFNDIIKCNHSILGECINALRKDNNNIAFKEINNMEIKDNILTIEIPEGMEVDTENSDLAKGIIKFKNKVLSYKTVYCEICNKSLVIDIHKEDENKLRAMSRLMNIAKYYNKDWRPDWSTASEYKYFIICVDDIYKIDYSWKSASNNIYFKNKKDAQEVIDNPNFRDILDAIYKK